MSKPLWDVVIPVHDRADHLRVCLESIWAFSPQGLLCDVRVILVNNASRETSTRQVLDNARDRGAVVIDRLKNDCFSASVNVGIAAGDAPNVLVLNSDTVLQPGWSSAFLDALADPRVGLAGAITNAASGLQARPELAAYGDPSYLIFFAVAGRRSTFERVGALDAETFNDWGGGEDLDYSWRVEDAGYRLALADTYVHHACSQTYSSTIGLEGRDELTARAQGRLCDKWGLEAVQRRTRLPIPRVMIATLSAEEWVHGQFAQRMLMLQRSPAEVIQVWHRRGVVHHAREELARFALERGDLTHVLWTDDDTLLERDTLLRLLAHKKDFVSATIHMRLPPHNPCIFRWKTELGGFVPAADIVGTGLRTIDASGFGCVLQTVESLRKVAEPRFEWGEHERPDGDASKGTFRLGEDMGFTHRLKQAGVELYADTDLILGHLGPPEVVGRDHFLRHYGLAD